MIKKITNYLLLILILSTGIAVQTFAYPTSSSYILINNQVDSGGTTNATSAGKNFVFQAAGNFSGTSAVDDDFVVTGMHISSTVYNILGYNSPYSKGTVTLNATVYGAINTQIEYLISINDSPATHLAYNTIDANTVTNGWPYAWNTIADVPVTAQVSILARAHDGLTWGPLTTIPPPLYVDNEIPIISSAVLTAAGLAINSSQGRIDAAWSATDSFQLYYDLYYATGPSYIYTDKSLDQSTNTSWYTAGLSDITNYKVKVVATDPAGNSAFQETNVVFTPDRTAPVISPTFNSVSGTQNINWLVDLTTKKSDNYFPTSNLGWTVTEYASTDNYTKSLTRQLFNSIELSGDTVSFNLMNQYANTDDTLAYNRYGYHGATFKLKLADPSGNYIEKDIVANVAHINSPPTINNLITDARSGTNQGSGFNYFNFFINENDAESILLDNFVDDVDTPTASLTFTVSSNAYINFAIGDATTSHRLSITPSNYWYGQTTVTINVTDGASVPTNSSAYQPIVLRIWPVNHAPVINPNITPIYSSTANRVGLDLSTVKSDLDSEETASNLNWNISYNEHAELFNAIVTQNDTVTLIPQANTYGIANLVLRLTDTDTVPQLTFPTYVPNPISTTINVSFPVIGTINEQETTKNYAAWNIGLTKISSVKDTGSNLTLQANADRTNYLNTSIVNNDVHNTLVTNAWGTSNVTFLLSYTDTTLKTAQKVVPYKVMFVNSTPEISAITLTAENNLLANKVKINEHLTITPTGYTDVGYSSDTRDTSAPGDEYALDSIPVLDYVKNYKLYNYTWKIDGTVYQQAVATNSIAHTITLPNTATLDGKTVSVEVTPYDGITTGLTLTNSWVVNSRPTPVVYNTPNNAYFITRNIMVSWNASTDADGDPIKYNYKIWKVADASVATPDLTSTPNWSSGWRSSFTSVDGSEYNYSGGYYYWAVLAGNEFNTGSGGYDYILPDARRFQVQQTAPPMSDVVGTDGIQPTQDIQEGGKYQLLYGNKPQYTGVWIEALNENQGVTRNDFFEAVPLNQYTTWQYLIQFPAGTTTYNVFFKDLANNISPTNTYQFVITEDLTPPVPATIQTGAVAEAGIYTALCNTASLGIGGTKEANTGLWFNDGTKKIQVVPFSEDTTFSFQVYSDRPTGVLTVKDWSLNESSGITINITFVVGSPNITVTKSRDILNTTPNMAGLSTASKNELAQSTIDWHCDRYVSTYSFVRNSDGVILLSGGSIATGNNTTSIIPGSALNLGDNTIVLNVVDYASNNGSLSFNLTRDEAAPTINTVSWFNKNGKAYISGKLAETIASMSETIFVNDSTANVIISGQNWFYQNNSFPFETTDIVVKSRDPVYNESTKTEWNHANYADLLAQGTLGQVVLADKLPDNIFNLMSTKVKKDSTQLYGLTVQGKEKLVIGATAKSDIVITTDLADTAYQIYAKKFDGSTVTSNLDLTGCNATLRLPFSDTLRIDVKKLIIVYFNPETGVWENPELRQTVDTANRTISATIPHLGIWGLAEYRPFATDLKSVRIYPNPWRPNSKLLGNSENEGITFDQLCENAQIRIYTITGQLVREETPNNSMWTWDGKNPYGKDVASDVYIYLIKAGPYKKDGKITIIR